jgi:hypothetical protein
MLLCEGGKEVSDGPVVGTVLVTSEASDVRIIDVSDTRTHGATSVPVRSSSIFFSFLFLNIFLKNICSAQQPIDTRYLCIFL